MAETCEIIDRYLGISTKGHTHRKRNPIPIQSLDFVIQNDTTLNVSAMVFLSNHCNKQDFGDLQSDKINTKTRFTAKKYSGDANRSMVTTALETVDLHKPLIRKADDTDALVMCQDESQTSGLFLERGGREGVYCIMYVYLPLRITATVPMSAPCHDLNHINSILQFKEINQGLPKAHRWVLKTISGTSQKSFFHLVCSGATSEKIQRLR